MSGTYVLRLKYYVGTHKQEFAVLSAVLVVLGLTVALTGFITPALAASPLATDGGNTQQTHGAGLSHSTAVEVTEDTDAYDSGEVLTERSLYPRYNTSPPVVTVTGETRGATLTHISVTVTHQAAPRTDVQNPFYTDERMLEEANVSGNQAELAAVVPIEDVFETQKDLEDEFGSDVEITSTIHTEIKYKYTSPDGTVIYQKATTSGDIRQTGMMYSLPGGTEQTTHTTGEEPADSGVLTPVLNAMGLISAIAGLIWLVTVTAFGRKVDIEHIAWEIQKKRFKDWVTEVESYTPSGSVDTVQVKTLNDLVNMAIDTQNRVLYHSQLQEYLIVDGNTMFKYAPENKESGGTTEFFGMDPSKLDLNPSTVLDENPGEMPENPTENENA